MLRIEDENGWNEEFTMDSIPVHHGKVYWPLYVARNTPIDVPKTVDEHRNKLNQLATKAGRMLLTVTAVFPFDFFPDRIIIDEYQVNIVNKIFFWSEQIRSIPIKDVTDVTLQTSLLFATLKICTNGPSDIPLVVNYLKKNDAREAKSLIQGLREAYKENIDVGFIENMDEVKEKAEFIGEGNTVPS